MPADTRGGDDSARWYLESHLQGQRGSRIRLSEWPFRVGRAGQVALTLPSNMISKEHAEIYLDNGQLRLRDLASKNGTFLNHERVENAPLHEGDVLHFAHLEFRLGRSRPEDDQRSETWSQSTSAVSVSAVYEGGKLLEMLRTGAAVAHFQPIVTLARQEVVAHEALGRGRMAGLPESPGALFSVAANMGVAPDLSRLLRGCALVAVRTRPDVRHLFLNLHPTELHSPGLLESLADLRAQAPEVALTLEFPETAVVEPGAMVGLKSRLKDMGLSLAYDDFGAGQARLLELAEIPPDYLKFDMSLVRGIDQAGPARHKLLASLVALAHDLGACTLAEGIETAGEASTCTEMGIELAQGFHFGSAGA